MNKISNNHELQPTRYVPVIGLEVHVELKTESKMFCSCSTQYFGKAPNSHVCPVCLGLPGALPVPNRIAIESCIKIALALNCKINEFSKFDRKNYFYPDLSKGYQISQYDLPFGYGGFIELKNKKRIGITRVHMEEDTGKLSHLELRDGKASLIDFNRSGVPLVEIVTEPDFEDALEVKEYLQKLQQIVRYLDVSNADMEKGEMRLEPNISLRESSAKGLPKYKVEVKNINSFKFVEKAIEYEVKRHQTILDEGGTPAQETRGWDENKQRTFSQRIKEDAHDYRYFPEPDIPPIITLADQLSTLNSSMPELPDAKLERFQKEFDLPYYDSEILTRDKAIADFFEEAVTVGKDHSISPKQISNIVINKKTDISSTLPAELIKNILDEKKILALDEGELESAIAQVLIQNIKAVEDYQNGKEGVIMFLLGQTIKKLGKKVDTELVREQLKKELKG